LGSGEDAEINVFPSLISKLKVMDGFILVGYPNTAEICEELAKEGV
jgi:hypothetical protein